MNKHYSTYDIVVVVDSGQSKGTHIYEKRTSDIVKQVVDAMDKDLVFLLLDDELLPTFFRPNEISKIQINLRESWTR